MCAVYDVFPISKSPLLSVKIFLGAHAYHLGSATDDNSLAVLANQICGGSPRGSILTVTTTKSLIICSFKKYRL
jgi:hypothetical protein